MHFLHVVGARPNFMKASPLMRALQQRRGVRQSLVHTGQHYDANMSDVFFSQLDIPSPNVNLEVGSGSHAHQTAEIMTRIEPVLLEYKPDMVIVYGDVNSTVAAALVCAKLLIPVAHVESGLRSFDRTMPEEVNRLVTDRLADLLFTPSDDGDKNLLNEGVGAERIHCVGNVMIDSLIRLLPAAEAMAGKDLPNKYALVTLHRPSNVDDSAILASILDSLVTISSEMSIVFPVHPRTRQRLRQIETSAPNLRLVDPLPYIEFLSLMKGATAVVTDSGGIQEETTYLGVPCLTLRSNTERPVTVTQGTNVLVGQSPEALRLELAKVLRGEAKTGTVPRLWDGRAGERIANILCGVDAQDG
jgi:UDP-N-acetylglucosamine 2-epimerase (non-hydrolysing)